MNINFSSGEMNNYRLSISTSQVAPNYNDDNNTNKFKFNILNSKSTFSEISDNYTLVLDKINNNSSLNVQVVNASNDLLDYGDSFNSDIISNSTGTIDINSIDSTLYLSKINTSFDNRLTFPLNKELSGEENLHLSIMNEKWSIANSDFAFNVIELSFNTLTLYLIYDYSESYLSLISNSTTKLYIIMNKSDDILSLKYLSSIANTTSPTFLESMSWNIYLTKLYTFNMVINNISLNRSVSNISYTLNNIPQISNNNILLDNDKEYRISIKNNINGMVNVTRSFFSKLTKNIKFSVINSLIYGNLSINKHDLNINYKNTIIFEENSFNVFYYSSNSWIRLNTSKMELNGNKSYLFLLKIFSYNNISDKIKPILQNETYKIKDTRYTINLVSSLLYKSGNNVLEGFIQDSVINFQIPLEFSKGEIFIYLIYQNFTVNILSTYINTLAARIIDIDMIVDSKVKTIIPIKIIDIISNNTIFPDRIYSYYLNNSYRAVDNSNGIIIWADEFTLGDNSLIVNATKFGFIINPIILDLHIIKIETDISINTERKSINNIFIIIYIPDFYYWQLNVQVNIKGNGFIMNNTLKNSVTQFYLVSELWTNSSITLNIIFIFGDNSGLTDLNVTVSPYYLPISNSSILNNSSNVSDGKKNNVKSSISYISTSIIGLIIVFNKLKHKSDKIVF